MSANFFHVAALAGAGTGKTYSLVENYVNALLGRDQSGEKKRPQEILALTFTEKAASEMRLRITQRLSQIITEGDPTFDSATIEEIRRAQRALPTAAIATFHSFCSQLLRKEATACGIDDRFTILSPKEELAIARNILRPIIIDAVSHHRRPIRNLVARMGLSPHRASLGLVDGLLDVYAKLFEKNIDCMQLVQMTSRNLIDDENLAAHLERIVCALHQFNLGKNSDKTRARLDYIATMFSDFSRAFHSNDAYLPRAFSNLRKAVSGNFGDHHARAMLVNAVTAMGNRLVDRAMQEQEQELSDVLTRFHEAFTQQKMLASVMSYSDLLLHTKLALRKDLALRKRVKQRIKHILVDEYQDTSPIQQDIIALLAEDRGCEAQLNAHERAIDAIDFSHGPSLFVVGDKKQSIYGFRGANSALFDEMVAKMARTHMTSEYFTRRMLVTNRRSQRRVIQFVNLVARHTLRTQGYDSEQALVPLDDVEDGRCGLWVSGDDKGLDKTTANLATAAFGIVQLLGTRKDLRPQDLVVLCRRIKSATVLRQKLAAFGIAARIVGGDGFFAQQEVADLLAALKLITDPSNAFACGIVLRSPLVLLTDQEIMACALESDDGLSLHALTKWCEEGACSSSSRERFMMFKAALDDAALHVAHGDVAAAIDALIDGCDAAYRYGLHDDAEQKWANIKKLRTSLTFVSKNPYAAIDEWYDEIFSQNKEPQALLLGEHDAVTIMTIHQSKGLEFKVVVLADTESALITNYGDFLVNGNDGLTIRPRGHAMSACAKARDEDDMPTRYERARRVQKENEEAEIARLLYVAMTRAKEELYVACSRASFVAKTLSLSLIGTFLRAVREAPEEFAAIATIEDINKPQDFSLSTTTVKSYEKCATVEKSITTTRWFASALNLSEDCALASVIKPCAPTNFRAVDGNLAHQLLATLAPLAWHRFDDAICDALLRASLRAQAVVYRDDDPTLLAVKETMRGLAAQIATPLWSMCEMPLRSMIVPGIVVEGFADLVIECDDFFGVIEFKSSRARVEHVNTYAQVLSYAHALAERTTKPIYYATMLVGSSTCAWQSYDSAMRQSFCQVIDSMRDRK